MVVEAGCYGNDTKSAFQNYVTENDMQYVAVWHQEGGKSPAGNNFNEALGNGGSGNPQYLIKTDKTFKKSPSASDINTAGGNVQHVCSTPITQELTSQKINSNISLYNAYKDGFAINVYKEGTYSIAFYSANGQLKSMVSNKHLSVGSHKINARLSSGFSIVEINNGSSIIREKVIIE